MQFFQIFMPYSIVNIESTGKYDAFNEMLKAITAQQPQLDAEDALRVLTEREQKLSTDIVPGIAVPHGICKSVTGVVGAFGLSFSGIDYGAIDGTLVHAVFMLLANPDSRGKLMQVMSKLALLHESPNFVAEVSAQKTADAIYDKLKEFFDNTRRL
jgi:mannitol/fructose-specific phosphotransferase system IIA component (Ntr-type)